MSALTDLKTQVDTLATSVPKLTTALTTAQAQIIDLHGKLDTAIANADDPTVLQSIKDELVGVQGTVDDAVAHTTDVSTAADTASAVDTTVPDTPVQPVTVTQALGPVSTDNNNTIDTPGATIAAAARTGAGNL